MTKRIWITLTNYNDTQTLKRHCFKPKISRGGNKRNISLCGNVRVGDDEGKSELFNNIGDFRDGDVSSICKSCLRISNLKQ